MNDGKMLAANIVYRALNVAVVFIINIFLSRIAGVAGYGLISLMIANATLFNLFSGFGIDSAITYHTAAGNINIHKLVRFVTRFVLLQVAAILLVELTSMAITGNGWLLKSGEYSHLWIGIVFLWSIAMIEKFTALFTGRQLFSQVNLALLAGNIVVAIALAFLYLFAGIDFLTLLKVYVVGNAVIALILVIFFNKKIGKENNPATSGDITWKVFFSYSLLAYTINLIQFVAYRVDYWLLDHYRGAEELGWYSMAVKLAQFMWVLPLLFASIIFPRTANQPNPAEEGKMLALIRCMNWLNLGAGILLFFTAGFFIPLLFGDDYASSVRLFQLLLPGVILFCIATVLASWFAGKNKLMINLAGSIICLGLILCLDLWLIPLRGMEGAAIASSVAYGITAIYFIVAYTILSKANPLRLFIPGKDDKHSVRSIFTSVFSKR